LKKTREQTDPEHLALKSFTAVWCFCLNEDCGNANSKSYHWIVKPEAKAAKAKDKVRGVTSREALITSFDKLRMNGKLLIPFVVSLSNHEWNQLVQRFPRG
jgi:hypothetical protein